MRKITRDAHSAQRVEFVRMDKSLEYVIPFLMELTKRLRGGLVPATGV